MIADYHMNQVSSSLKSNLTESQLEEAIFNKILVCEIVFNFSLEDDTKHLESKTIKRDCLLELIDFFDSDE